MNNEKEFTHLHVHDDYSLLDGLGKIPDYVAKAKSLGMNALAFTNHGTMAGLVTAYDECKKAGIKFIGGFEAYAAPHDKSRFEKKGLEGKPEMRRPGVRSTSSEIPDIKAESAYLDSAFLLR